MVYTVVRLLLIVATLWRVTAQRAFLYLIEAGCQYLTKALRLPRDDDAVVWHVMKGPWLNCVHKLQIPRHVCWVSPHSHITKENTAVDNHDALPLLQVLRPQHCTPKLIYYFGTRDNCFQKSVTKTPEGNYELRHVWLR